MDVWLSLDKIFLVVYEFHHTLSQIFHIYQEIVRVIKGIVSSCFLDLQPSRIWSCIENKFFVYGDPKFTASLDRWNVIPACHCNSYSLKCTLWSTRNKRAKIISPLLRKQHGKLLQTSSSTASAATTSSTTSRRETWKCVFIISKGTRYSNHSVEVKEARELPGLPIVNLEKQNLKRTRTWLQMLAIHYYACSTTHCIVGSFFAGEDSRWRRSWWILGKESLSQHLVWPLDGDFKRLVRHFLNRR